MGNFRQGLNQFWVGAVFGVCLALSLVLIPVAIVISSINDVLKIHEVSTLVTQVTQLIDNTKDQLVKGKEQLASFSFVDLDKDVLTKVISTVQDYQLKSHTLLTETEKQALQDKLAVKLQQELSQSLSQEQRALAMSLFQRFVSIKPEQKELKVPR